MKPMQVQLSSVVPANTATLRDGQLAQAAQKRLQVPFRSLSIC